MLIYGIAKDQEGNDYYMVKNSWGKAGKYDGLWYASKAFVRYKTCLLYTSVISSCSNDELAPISLKNRETANIKLNYPNNQTYSFPLQGGDGNYEIDVYKRQVENESDTAFYTIRV